MTREEAVQKFAELAPDWSPLPARDDMPGALEMVRPTKASVTFFLPDLMDETIADHVRFWTEH